MMNSPPPPPSSTCSDRANDKRRILVRSLLKSKLFGGLGFIFFLGLVLFQYSLSNLKAVVDDPTQHQFHKKEAVLKTQSRDSKYHSKKTSKWGELAKKSRQSSKKNQEKKKQGSAKKGGDDDREKEERGKERDAMFPFQKPARRMAELYANELEFPFEQSMPGNTSEDIREPSPPYREIYILGVHHSATSIVSKAVLAMGAWGGLEGDLLLADPAKPARKQHKFFEQADLVALGDRAYAWCGVGRAGRRGAKAAREVAWEGFRGWEGRAPPPGGGGGESESESGGGGGGGGFAPPLWAGWGFDCERFLSEANRRQFRSEAAWLLKKYRHARDKHRRGALALKDPRLALALPLWRAEALAKAGDGGPFVCVVAYRNPLGSARGMMQWGGDSLDLQDWVQIWASTMLNVMTGCAGMPITIIRQPELLADAYSSLKTLEESLTRIGVPGLALPLRRSEGDPTRHLPKAPPRRGARTPEEALGDPHPFSHAELGIIHLMESLPRESHWSIAEMQAKLAPIKYAAAQAAPRTGAWAAGDPSSIHLFAWCPPGPGEGGEGGAACALSPRQLRCLEALVARHPRRRVVLASNREFDLEQLKGFRKLRYSIWMVTYKQIVGYLPKKLWPFKHIKLGDALKGEPALTWQVLAAFLWGGLALPLGALPLRSLDALPDRTLAYQAPFGSLSVFLKFDEPENEFLGKVLREYFLLKKENNYSSLMDHNLFDLLISRLQEYRGELPITVDSEEIFDQRFTLSNITQCFDANSPPTGIVGGGAFLLDLHDDATRAHALDRDAECQVLLRSSCLFCDEVLEPYTMAAAGAPGPSAGQGGGSQAKRAAAARAARPLAVNRPPLPPPGGPAAFRLAWTTPAATFAPWRRRALAAVFAHHPDAQVNYYSNSLTQDMFSEFTDVGYAARAVPLACGAIFQNTPLEGWYQQVDEWRQGPFFYSHLTDALRLALMWKFGGIYMDADFVVMSNLTALPTMVGSQGEPKHDLNGAFMKMPPGHPFLALAMEGYLRRYDPALCDKTRGRGGRGPEAWRGCYAKNWNLVGPDLVTETARRFRELAPSLVTDLTSYSSTPGETVISRHPSALNIFPWQTLYPIPWTDAEKPYFVLPGAASEKEVQQVKSEYKSLAMHLWSNRNKYRGIPPFSFGDLLLKEHSSRILDTLAEDEWLQQMQSKVTVIFTSRSAAPAPGVAIFSSGTSDRRPGLMVLSATAQGTPTVVQCPKERDPEVCLRQLEPADGLDSNVPEGELARAMRAVPGALSATPYIAWVGEGATLPGTRNLEWAVDILENNPDIGVIGAVPFKNGKALNLETYKRISCDKEDKQGQGRQCACTNPLDDSGGLQETLYLGFPMLIGRATVLQKAVVRLTPRTNQHTAEIKDGQFFLLMSTIVGQGDSVYLMPEIRSEYLGAGESAKDFWHDKQLDENLTAIRIRQCSAKQSSKTRSHDIVSLEPE